MAPSIWIDKLTFSDDKTLQFVSGDVVVIVGPNNSGKSATLRAIRDKVSDPNRTSPVVKEVILGKVGTPDDVIDWLGSVTRIDIKPNPSDPHYQAFNTSVTDSQARSLWMDVNNRLLSLGRFFCHLLSAEERLTAANAAPAVAITQEPLTHPIHSLQRNDDLERTISAQFRKAFGADLVVHRNAGNRVPLHVGERPSLSTTAQAAPSTVLASASSGTCGRRRCGLGGSGRWRASAPSR